jgi:hypothetical protein
MDASSRRIALTMQATPWLRTQQRTCSCDVSLTWRVAVCVQCFAHRLNTKWGDGPRLKRKERVSVQQDTMVQLHTHTSSALCFALRQCCRLTVAVLGSEPTRSCFAALLLPLLCHAAGPGVGGVQCSGQVEP